MLSQVVQNKHPSNQPHHVDFRFNSLQALSSRHKVHLIPGFGNRRPPQIDISDVLACVLFLKNS